MDQQISEEELKNMSPEQIAELQKQNCIFCKIIKGEIPSKKVYEDEKCVGILDINPASEGHVLILPKEHFQILPQIPEDLINHLFVVSKEISHSVLQAFGAKGTNIFVANGAVAGQRAPHFMVHVFQRTEGDGIFANKTVTLSSDDIQKLKEHLLPKINLLFGVEQKSEDILDDENIDEGLVSELQKKTKKNVPDNGEPEDENEQNNQLEYNEEESEEDEENTDKNVSHDDDLDDLEPPSEPEEDEDDEEIEEDEEKDDLHMDTDEKIDLDKIGELFK